MAVQLIRADRLYGGVPYAYATIAAPGALVFTLARARSTRTVR